MINTPTKKDNNIIKKISSILIAQEKPNGPKSAYFDLASKYNLEIEFFPFIKIEGIAARDFRKQKINIPDFTAVIFTSRHAVDHFFRMVEEMRINLSQDLKYFCITEAVALYLQKFILYRKRKVFHSADGTTKTLLDILNKYREQEKFLYPCSETFDSEITSCLSSRGFSYATPVIYKVVNRDIKDKINKNFDMVCVFTPGGIKSLLENFPDYKQNISLLATFGENTLRAAEQHGLTLNIIAPQPKMPTMASAIENYILAQINESAQ